MWFGKDELHCLGQVVGKGDIKVGPKKFVLVKKWHRLLKLDNYDLFGGLYNYFPNSCIDILL